MGKTPPAGGPRPTGCGPSPRGWGRLLHHDRFKTPLSPGPSPRGWGNSHLCLPGLGISPCGPSPTRWGKLPVEVRRKKFHHPHAGGIFTASMRRNAGRLSFNSLLRCFRTIPPRGGEKAPKRTPGTIYRRRTIPTRVGETTTPVRVCCEEGCDHPYAGGEKPPRQACDRIWQRGPCPTRVGENPG